MKTVNINAEKKITLATLKSFIKNNREALLIECKSRFNGMEDCVTYDRDSTFVPVTPSDRNQENTLGIAGAWLVGSSRDYFRYFETDKLIGIDCYNCCGSFIIAINK